jgi:hypothetical protein
MHYKRALLSPTAGPNIIVVNRNQMNHSHASNICYILLFSYWFLSLIHCRRKGENSLNQLWKICCYWRIQLRIYGSYIFLILQLICGLLVFNKMHFFLADFSKHLPRWNLILRSQKEVPFSNLLQVFSTCYFLPP